MKRRTVRATCPRAFEAEAMRDGRLSGAARASFEAHAQGCASCTHELRALEALSRALRSTGAVETDELQARRERTRLLAAFDETLAPPSARPKSWLALGVVAAVLTTAAVLAFWPRSVGPVASPRELARVRADSSARWSRRVEPGLETLTLESGTLTVEVEHGRQSRRLLVVLPDGELDDIGTIFSVAASAGHTTSVTVRQGHVVLRLREQPPLVLGAGQSFSAAKARAASAAFTAAATPSALPAASTAAVAPSAVPAAPAPLAVPSFGVARRGVTTAGEPRHAADPAADFREALAALNGADNERAAALFATFLVEHPRDSRAEDASYLRVIALERAGKPEEMRRAARAYLRRYPSGFRRDEVEALTP